ncbi:uncharacterized protein LOC144351319 [Saccoglossus kowalevskii]
MYANSTGGTEKQRPAEEVKYSSDDANYVAVTMQSPTLKKWIPGYIPATPRTIVENTTRMTPPQNVTMDTAVLINGNVTVHFSDATHKYANFRQRNATTQVNMTMNLTCCHDNVTTLSNSTDTDSNNSDDALGPVIAGLCTAVGLLLCLWLICFAVEKRIHSRKRAVERHYLPQSRSYPVQVAEMRKVLRTTGHRTTDSQDRESTGRNSWGISNPFSRGRNRDIIDENGEPSCIVASRHIGGIKTPTITLTSASPEPRIPVIHEAALEMPANGCPGKKIPTCRSAPAIVTFDMENPYNQQEEDSQSATSDNASDDVIQLANKPTRMFLTVGDAYTYTPGGVFLEELGSSTSLNSEDIELANRHVPKDNDSGANAENYEKPLPDEGIVIPCRTPQENGLNVQFRLEIDESQCSTR